MNPTMDVTTDLTKIATKIATAASDLMQCSAYIDIPLLLQCMERYDYNYHTLLTYYYPVIRGELALQVAEKDLIEAWEAALDAAIHHETQCIEWGQEILEIIEHVRRAHVVKNPAPTGS